LPELIVLDLALGQSDAVEVVRYLEVMKYSGKVLLMSGHDPSMLSEIEEIGRSHGLDMLPSLHKPFRVNELKDRLTHVGGAPSGQIATDDARSAVVKSAEQSSRKSWSTSKKPSRIAAGALVSTENRPEDECRYAVPRRCCAHASRVRRRLAGQSPAARGRSVVQSLTRFVLGRAMADWERFASIRCRSSWP